MAVTLDRDFFIAMEETDILKDRDAVVKKSVELKKYVVDNDRTEKGLRRVLNFGHTIGHAIESLEGGRFLHGECVALGMLPMCSDDVRERLVRIYSKIDLPVSYSADPDELLKLVVHDKKMTGDKVRAVTCESAGSFEIEAVELDALKARMTAFYK